MKKYIILLLLLSVISAHAKPSNSFRTFLAQMQELSVDNIQDFDITSFNTIDADLYGAFLPHQGDKCPCNSEHIVWLKGVYKTLDKVVMTVLPRACLCYHDEMQRYVIENLVTDYILITYSHEGKILDYKMIGQQGFGKFSHLEYRVHHHAIISEQGYLTDASLIKQYKPQVYTITKHQYTFEDGKRGRIRTKQIAEVREKVIPDNNPQNTNLTYQEFRSYFRKWTKDYVNDEVFSHNEYRKELPSPSVYSIISDTLDCNCWPRDILWTPGHYIETELHTYFFLVKDCTIPKQGEPFVENFILVFNKEGTLLVVQKVDHLSTSSIQQFVHALPPDSV